MASRVLSGLRRAVTALRREKQVPIVQQLPQDSLLDGKVALVTGGSGGIGTAVAKRLFDSGAKVVITGTSEQKLARCAESLDPGGNRLGWAVANLGDVGSLPKAVADCASAFPERRIDILVNCAGLIGHAKFLDVGEDEFDAILDVNLKGTFFISQAVARHMIDQGIRGHILNVSSASALRPAQTPYNVSKWGIRGLTLGMADALAPYGITVNAVGPGPVATPMLGKSEGDGIEHPSNPMGRYATPEEVANLAVFLVSDAANLIVGETVYITGGAGTISLHR